MLDLRGTRTPNLWIHAECSNHLSYQGQTFAAPCFEHWLWRYRYILSKVNIWNVNCARATAFIFDTRTDILVILSKVLRPKCLDPRGTRTPNLRIHAECSSHLSYQGQTFAVQCFGHWLWRYKYFQSKVKISNANCALTTTFIFDTRTDVRLKVSKFLRQKMSRPERDSNPQSSDSCRMV